MAPTLTSPNTDNYFIGKGLVSIKLDTDPDYVDIGNVPTFEFTPSVTKLDHFSSRAGIKSKDKSVIQEKSAQLHMIMEEFTGRNLALALLGTLDDSDPSNTTIDIFSGDSVTCAVKLVGTNDVGPQWTCIFPEVEFTPSAAIGLIQDAFGQLDITGEVLFQEDLQSFGTMTADFSQS